MIDAELKIYLDKINKDRKDKRQRALLNPFWVYRFAKQALESGRLTVHGRKFLYWIIPAPMEGSLNGYVVFWKRPVRELEYEGILTYVPVHGGITFAKPVLWGMVYGFDTLHCDSKEFLRGQRTWIREQIGIMASGILVASQVEDDYLKAKDNKGKAEFAQQVQNCGSPEQRRNFGVSINLLTGKL